MVNLVSIQNVCCENSLFPKYLAQCMAHSRLGGECFLSLFQHGTSFFPKDFSEYPLTNPALFICVYLANMN